ncbi:DMT family transporter [Komagataeibacter sp. FNDCF1]|uniref:DMT family transporter n=1 Tax=Komagataeibacter sp. FNDCF1 TaxID=2878681 RepID=UPI001E567BB0|nr:DMT family transporter [Komagataeibacter sp. FNDCF1]MCE2563636.1 DMT family transporter [Komagataeibacter sp. FNDCF1]
MTAAETTDQPGSVHNIPLGMMWGAGAGALWGLIMLAPELVRAFTPLQLSTGRYLAYGVIAAVLAAPRWRRLVSGLDRHDWFALFWLSLLGNTLYYILLSMAVRTGGIALTSLVMGFLPVVVTIVGSRDRGAVSLAALAPSLLLCAGGAICIGWQAVASPGATGQSVTGLVFAVMALASWTSYTVGNSRCLMRLSDISVDDWNLLTGLMTGAQAVLLVPAAFLIHGSHHDPGEWEWFALVAITLAITASIFGNAFWNRMSRLVPLTMTGQMILFETLFALIYGCLWEDRWPRPLEMAAFVLIVLSVLTCVSVHHRRVSGRRNTSESLAENGV